MASNSIVQVRLTNGPIVTPKAFPPPGLEVAGAVVMFRGVVRPKEEGPEEKGPVGKGPEGKDIAEKGNSARGTDNKEHPITGLNYQVYEPMTSVELTRLAEAQLAKHDVIAIDVEHSDGFVAAGECSFVLQVAGKHRGEAIRLMDEFIIEMKRHVPIWKVPAFVDKSNRASASDTQTST